MSEFAAELVKFNAKDPNQALEAALATVRSFCNWHIAPSQSWTFDVWCYDGERVFVPTLKLTAVTEVSQDGVTIDSGSYTFESYGLIRMLPESGVFLSELTKVHVEVTHGYATMPDDVRDVILLAAQRAIQDTRGLVPRISGGPAFMENRGPRLEKDDKDRLAPYALTGGFA